MIFTATALPEVYLIDIEPIEDQRGFFARTWCQEEFRDYGLDANLTQCNIAFNTHKGTLRGMHFQKDPHAEVKIVRCSRGSAYDVLVDLRSQSPTYKQWLAIEISMFNRRSIYIPQGVAHGYLTLENDTELHYQMSSAYVPEASSGIRWDDPVFAIDWPFTPCVISDKDNSYPDYQG